MNPTLLAQKPYPMAELQARKAALVQAGKTVFDFGTGDPIEPTPAFIPAALKAAVPSTSQYPSVAGTPALREAAAGYLRRRFGVTVNPTTQLLPSAGSKEAIFHLPLAIVDPAKDKRTVIWGTPGYPVYESGALFVGGVSHPIVLERSNGYRLDLERLPTELLQRTALVWLNYPHNPTGACVDDAYYATQLAICRAHGIVLASDECYQDLWFSDAPLSPKSGPPSALQAAGDDLRNLLVFHSCSKRSGMTGYRSGFVAGDAALIQAYRGWRAHFGVGSPAFIEQAAAAAWRDDAHADERRAIFARKYHLLADGLSAKGIEILPSEAGLYLWAKPPAGITADAYADRCLAAGIVISPGGFFGNGGDGWFRLALVPGLAACAEALGRWPSHDR